MDRSLYPEGVEVHQDDLERTESTRAFHILQRQLDTTDTGVVSGFAVTLNADPTKLMLLLVLDMHLMAHMWNF